MIRDWRDHHPHSLAVISSQRGHMPQHHYLWREEGNLQQLFELEDTLLAQGEYVLWPR